jgi:acyl-CoA synthetase (AMP-forming)/AMP-acid ligase II
MTVSEMLDYANLVDLLQHRSQQQSDRVAYTFLQDGETESGHLTYAELDRQAKAIAVKLQSLVPEGSKALVVYPYHAGLEFISAFFGCLYAGIVAVTDSPPRHSKAIAKLHIRAVSSGAKIGLTTRSLLDQIEVELAKNAELAGYLRDIVWIATDDLIELAPEKWVKPEITKDTLAFFQYTSGSTGVSKGVMVTHGNIIYNEQTIKKSFQHDDRTIFVGWLPMFHDMGLIGNVLQPMYLGIHSVLMSPISLVQKPINWLQAISRYRATTSGGPNFAYDLLCLKITPEQKQNLDLSSWQVAFSGAEAVRAETMRRFAEIFAPCGFRYEAFYPCYGMAETTLFVTGGIAQEAPIVKYLDSKALEENRVVEVNCQQEGARAIVGCGRTWLEDKVIIVDPKSLKSCSSDRIGEIWVSGPGVGKGYWNQPEETRNTFGAHLLDNTEETFLRTGDLGFIQDGELFITGRYKEVMIIWGRYQYPQHIELTVQKSHPALRLNGGAAFSVDVDGEEKLVIAQEVERTYIKNLNLEEIVGAVRMAVAKEHMAEVYAVILLKPASLPKTSSGKIQRRGCRAKYLEGSLESIAEWKNTSARSSDTLDMIGAAEDIDLF